LDVTAKRNLEIEALRALAILIVLVGHTPTLLYWKAPEFAYAEWFGGVDLFFVISGFVITLTFYDELRAAVLDDRECYWRLVGAFWIRRAFRIIPASWLWLAITIALSVAFNRSGIFGTTLGNIGDFLSVALNVANFHFTQCEANHALVWCGWNGVYWSISLEEQFYLIFPLLIFLPKRWLAILLAAVIIVQPFRTPATLVYMTRFDGISLGVLLGFFRMTMAYRVLEPTFLARSWVRIPVACLLVAGIVVVPGGGGIIPYFMSLVIAVCGVLVLIASFDKGYLIGPGFFRMALVWIGERSFAIYLMHNTVFWIIREVWFRWSSVPPTDAQTIPFLVIAGCMIAVLSDLSFRFFETPLRRRGKRIAAEFTISNPTSVRPS
jgi:peptidoglycan/LPS O-acetylase OafA/YrhL